MTSPTAEQHRVICLSAPSGAIVYLAHHAHGDERWFRDDCHRDDVFRRLRQQARTSAGFAAATSHALSRPARTAAAALPRRRTGRGRYPGARRRRWCARRGKDRRRPVPCRAAGVCLRRLPPGPARRRGDDRDHRGADKHESGGERKQAPARVPEHHLPEERHGIPEDRDERHADRGCRSDRARPRGPPPPGQRRTVQVAEPARRRHHPQGCQWQRHEERLDQHRQI